MSSEPSLNPTWERTYRPTFELTSEPSYDSTEGPTSSIFANPTFEPSNDPTAAPSLILDPWPLPFRSRDREGTNERDDKSRIRESRDVSAGDRKLRAKNNLPTNGHTASCVSEEVIVQEDFENKSLQGWIKGKLDYSSGLTNYLGQFRQGNDEAMKTYSNIPVEASYLSVEFDIYEIVCTDAARRNSTYAFLVFIDGVKLELSTFGLSSDKEYRSGSASGILWESHEQDSPTYLMSTKDSLDSSNAKTHHIKATVPASYLVDGALTLKFQAVVTSTIDENSAGIDNLKMTVHRRCQCQAVETVLDTTCNHGSYGAENVELLSGNGVSVSFRLKHSFGYTLTPIEVWMENPNQGESSDLCSQYLSISSGTVFDTYTAKCTNGWAKLSIQAGSSSGVNSFRHVLDVDDPFCQEGVDVPDFNPLKRCYWEFQVPCNCHPTESGRRTEEISALHSPKKLPVHIGTTMIHPVVVDKCILKDKHPVKILDQEIDHVRVEIHQNWNPDSTVEWMSLDYVGSTGELVCSSFELISGGPVTTLTAYCDELGTTVIDIYTHDEQVFGQRDGSPVSIPTACGATSQDPIKSCHFRYILSCKSSEDDLSAHSSLRRS